jgi:murein DD-endopeptidase MepM/ murein hydrolase activator NlpD
VNLPQDFYKNIIKDPNAGSRYFKTMNQDLMGNDLTLYRNNILPSNRYIDTSIMKTEPRDIKKQNQYFHQYVGVANPVKFDFPKRNLGSFLSESVEMIYDSRTGANLGLDDKLRKPKNLTGVSSPVSSPVASANVNTVLPGTVLKQPETTTNYTRQETANIPQSKVTKPLSQVLGVSTKVPTDVNYSESGLVNHYADWNSDTYNSSFREIRPSITPAQAPKVAGVLAEQFPVSQGEHGGWGNKALDIATPVGTLVKSPKNGGVVTMINAYNGEAIVTYPDGSKVIAMHMSKIPTLGSTVNAGDTIGATGNVGRSDGAHLHLEYFENGQYVSPAGILY